MSAVYASVTEQNVFEVLRSFILSVVDCEVVRTQVNRVPMPLGDFIALTPTRTIALETNTHAYTDTTKTTNRPTEFDVQIDSYGSRAYDRAYTIASLLRDDVAYESFLASGYEIAPLWAGDAQQLPLIDGEEQYVERWTFEAKLQVNGVITQAIDTANTLAIGTISVDRTYAP